MNAQPLSGLPVGGNAVLLVQGNGPAGAMASNVFFVHFFPDGFQLLPQCRLYTWPTGPMVTHNLLLLDPSGSGATSWQVPSGFPGVMLVVQSAAFGVNSPQGFVLSNACVAVLL